VCQRSLAPLGVVLVTRLLRLTVVVGQVFDKVVALNVGVVFTGQSTTTDVLQETEAFGELTTTV
jgi:hypothetical protein